VVSASSIIYTNLLVLDPCATAPKFYNKRRAAAVIFVAEPNSSRICKTCQPAEYFFGAISAQTEIKATAIENQNNVQNYGENRSSQL